MALQGVPARADPGRPPGLCRRTRRCQGREDGLVDAAAAGASVGVSSTAPHTQTRNLGRPTRIGKNAPMAGLFKAFLLCCALSGCAVAAASIEGRVIGVADGDTVTVLDDQHHQHKIRLAGIDAPEKRAGLRPPFQEKPQRTWPIASKRRSRPARPIATDAWWARSPSTARTSTSSRCAGAWLGIHLRHGRAGRSAAAS